MANESGGGKRVAIQMGIGALLGVVGWNLTGPRFLTWWITPSNHDQFSCAPSIRDALTQFVELQIGVTVASALTLALVLFLIRRKLGGAKAAPVPPSLPPVT